MNTSTSTTTPTAPARMVIDVWADVVCTYCYLGEHRLTQAIAQSQYSDQIDLRVHTFELHPDAPKEPTATAEYFAKFKGVPIAQGQSMDKGWAEQARADGLRFEVDRPFANTHDMLRLVKLATGHGLGWEMMLALQGEVFSGNWDAFEHDTLIRVAEDLGIPSTETRDMLASDKYADVVASDTDAAARMGANGVPFTVLGERLGIPGAVSTEDYASAIDQAWEQIHG